MRPSIIDIAVLYINENTLVDVDFLEGLASEILISKDYSFNNGLIGFGWLVGFLIDNNFIEGNADEILEDIDDLIYKLTIRDVLNENIEVYQLLFYITYYQQRIQYNSSAHFYRRFTHIECLKLLLTKVNNYLDQSSLTSNKEIEKLTDILLKYSYLMRTCIDETLVEQSFYGSIERLLSFYEQQGTKKVNIDSLLKLSIAIRQYRHSIWEKRLKKLLESITNSLLHRNVWVELLNCESWTVENFMQIREIDKANTEFIFHGLTNLKVFD